MLSSVIQQEKNVFSRKLRKYYTDQPTDLARCLAIICKFFILEYNENALIDFPHDTAISSQIITAVNQQSLQSIPRSINEIDLNSMTCPHILIKKESQELALLIPDHQGKLLLYSLSSQNYQTISQVNITEWEETAYEILPVYKQSDISLKKILLRWLVKGNFNSLLVFGVISVMAAFMMAMLPIATGYLISNTISVSDSSVIITIAVILLIFSFISFGLLMLRRILMIRVHTKIRYIMLSGLIGRFLLLPINFFVKRSSGFAQQIMNVSSEFVAQTIDFVTSLMSHVIFVVVTLCIMFFILWKIALLQLLFVIIISCVSLLFSWLRKKPMQIALDKQGDSMDTCFGYINSIEKLLVYDKSAYAAENCKQSIVNYLFPEYFTFLYDVYSTMFMLLLQATSILITIVVISFIYHNSVNMGSLVSFLGVAGIFINYTVALVKLLGEKFVLQIQYQKVKQVLNEKISYEFGHEMIDVNGNVKMRNISFQYNDIMILSDVNIEIIQGEKIAIVGSSGSGKSTLLKLMIGLERTDNGTVLIDNAPINNLDITNYRLQVAYSSQEDRLFNGSIKDNITLGESYSDQELWDAIKFAGCEEIISKLPMKINSIVSENVSTFSDGEIKRLLLARCIVRSPKILLLDDALNGLEVKLTQSLTENLLKYKQTCILATQKTDQIMKFDRIFFMDKGKIVEQGTYKELMSNKAGFYQYVTGQNIEQG